jgi:hypothetical protein
VIREDVMPVKAETDWLAVIGRTLSYLCLEHARKEAPGKFNTVPKKVDFLVGMGLPKDIAAYVAGSSPGSLAVLEGRLKKGGKNAKKGKK